MTRRPTPAITELRGSQIRLRPFRAEEIDEAWQGLALQDEAAHPRPRPEDRRPFQRGLVEALSVRGDCGEDVSISPSSAKAG